MARHRRPVHDHHYGRLFAVIVGIFATLFLTAATAKAGTVKHHPTKISGITRAAPAADYHAGYYRHVAGTTYQVWLVAWAPSSEYTLFKKSATSSTFNEVPNSTRAFDNEVTFNVGVRNGTTLEIDVWNGQQTTTSFFFVGDDTVAAPAGVTWGRMH